MKGSGSVIEQWEANSELKQSDTIPFSFLKKEHGGDGLNPWKENEQEASEAVSCVSLSILQLPPSS